MVGISKQSSVLLGQYWWKVTTELQHAGFHFCVTVNGFPFSLIT